MTHATPVAVITGANRGLGLETCRQLARRGNSVVLTCRAQARGEAAAAQLRGEDLDVRFQRLDVTEAAAVDALSAFLQAEFGRLDILINNIERGGWPVVHGPYDQKQWDLEMATTLERSASLPMSAESASPGADRGFPPTVAAGSDPVSHR